MGGVRCNHIQKMLKKLKNIVNVIIIIIGIVSQIDMIIIVMKLFINYIVKIHEKDFMLVSQDMDGLREK